MNETREKTSTVKRIRSLEQSRFDALVVELAEIRKTVAELRNRQQDIGNLIAESPASYGHCVAELQQRLAWSNQLQEQWERIAELIRDFSEQQDALMTQILGQNTAIKGWDSLLQRLDAEMEIESNRRRDAQADDAHLNRLTAAGRDSSFGPQPSQTATSQTGTLK